MPGCRCPYCGQKAEYLASSAEVYRGRDFGPIWICRPCRAWVGCHAGTRIPLGRLANGELRLWKVRAHAAFDPLWRGPGATLTRGQAYRWLADRLGTTRRACHIGNMSVDECKRVVAVCSQALAQEDA